MGTRGGHSAVRDPAWARILEEEIPGATVRLIGLDVRETSTYWPLLQAILARWTDWFRYVKTAGSLPLGISVPSLEMRLSPEFGKYLAYNFPAMLREEFRAEVTSSREETAFRQALLAILERAGRDLEPLDPLRAIGEFPTEREVHRELQVLNANYRAFPYIGRAGDLQKLWDWLNAPTPISFQVVCGRGGSGKTRLAYQFLEELEMKAPFAGWHAGLLESARIGDALRNEKFRRWRRRQPTLIVIDYAASCTEQLAANVIRELRSSSLGSEAEAAPLRFLLLERGADEQKGWYNTLLRAAGDRREEFFPNAALELSRLNADELVRLFAEVLDSLGRLDMRMGRAARAALPLPADLAARFEERKIADPLVISMAAMVASERGDLGALDLDRIDLARGVADHEYRRLEELARAAGYRPFLLLHLAACATLAGEFTTTECDAVCREEKEHIESDWKLPELLECLTSRALPAERRSSGVAGIVPDIVGEAFVLEIFRQEGHEPEQAIVRVAERKLRPVVRGLVRIIQDFAPDPMKPRVEDEEDQKRALAWLVHLLGRWSGAGERKLRDEDFWEIRFALPVDSITMGRAAREFYRTVMAGRELTASDLVAIGATESYAIHSGRLGYRHSALESMTKVIPLRRELAASDPDAFFPALAMSLNNQSNMQSDMGQRPEALASIAEAVDIRRKLASANPDAFLPNLAISHGVWGLIVLDQHQFAEGVRLVTPFARRLPQAHFPLAKWLAQAYAGACQTAGMVPDPELLWPLQ